MTELLAWLDALPTWMVGGGALIGVIVAVAIGIRLRGFLMACTKAEPVDWDYVYNHRGPGGFDVDTDGGGAS